jgi:hypothetical protein
MSFAYAKYPHFAQESEFTRFSRDLIAWISTASLDGANTDRFLKMTGLDVRPSPWSHCNVTRTRFAAWTLVALPACDSIACAPGSPSRSHNIPAGMQSASFSRDNGI